MYKDLAKWVIAITTTPGKAWKELAQKEEKGDEFLTQFVFPLIGLVTLAAFTGILFTHREFSIELALKSSIKVLISYFGGFYLASYWLNELLESMFGKEKNLKHVQRFVGYSSAMMYVLNALLLLFPVSEFFFLRIFILYTAYIVWEGALPYMQIGKKQRIKFMVMAGALIIVLPVVIELLLFMLMPGMRV
jgi:hypothetical protein